MARTKTTTDDSVALETLEDVVFDGDQAMTQPEATESRTETWAPQATQATAAPPQKPPRLVYIGPNIPGGELDQFAVFKGGIPAYLPVVKAIPEISKLFVPVDRLSTAKENLKKDGSKEHRLYHAVKQKLEKRGG